MKHKVSKGSDGRIFWTDEEYEKVLKNYHNMLVKGTVPNKSEEAMREAQKVLPKDRHRNFKYSAQAAPLLRKYREMVKLGKITNVPAHAKAKLESRRKPSTPDHKAPGPVTITKPAPAPTPLETIELMPGVKIPKDIYEASIKHHLSLNPVQEPSLDTAFKHILNKVVDERMAAREAQIFQQFDTRLIAQENQIFERFNGLILQGNKNIQEAFVGMQDTMRTMIRESHVAVLRALDPNFSLPDDKPADDKSTAVAHVHESTPVVPTDKKRKPKILIAGGEKRLGESIKQRFPQMEIIQYDQQGLTNRDLSAQFDLVIGSRWLAHSMQSRLKNAYGDKFEYVEGAISSISDRINERVGQFIH